MTDGLGITRTVCDCVYGETRGRVLETGGLQLFSLTFRNIRTLAFVKRLIRFVEVIYFFSFFSKINHYIEFYQRVNAIPTD